MAKSLRSKRRRKMRAVKRERYGVKELDRLKKTLANDNVKKEIDEVMTDVSDLVTKTNSKTIKKNANKNAETITETEQMDDDSVKHVYNNKTLRDQFGSYPVWMSQRRVTKNKQKKTKKGKSKTKKK